MRIQAGIWTAVLALLLTATPLTASAAPGENRGRGAENRSERADAALEAAKAIFDTRPSASRRGGESTSELAASSEHASLVLRDLAIGLDDLDGADRRVAERILARPSDVGGDALPGIGVVKYDESPVNTCTVTGSAELDVCLHWIPDASSEHAPPLDDSNGNGVPDWVETSQSVFAEVWTRIIDELGYRRPVEDSGAPNHGPDGRTDIYLAQLGGFKGALFGYCVPEPVAGSSRRLPAYCVIDNDYAEKSKYGDRLNALKVTAAHEFFHAIQFGYWVEADHWVMEGTAAWIEDEVYDDINDNLQFLQLSALSFPHAPLDYGLADHYGWLYGSWIWWRFLTERFGGPGKADPTVVRQVWRKMRDGAATIPAQRRTIAERGTDFGSAFAEFAAANRIAGRWYSEGRRYMEFVSPPAGRFTLTRNRPGTGLKATRLDHLSSKPVVLRPGRGIRGKWRLRIDLDLPPRLRGSQATAIIHRKDGRSRFVRARLDKRGDGRVVVPFNRRDIARVTLSLTNASTRFVDCRRFDDWRRTEWTCGGRPLDDGLVFAFRARAVR